MEILTVEALSAASLASQVAALPHGTSAYVTATEHGTPWAVLRVSPLTDTRVSVFPLIPTSGGKGITGDSRVKGQAGVHYPHGGADTATFLRVVIERARRMYSL